MEFSEYLSLIRQKKQTIASLLIVFLVIAAALTFIQPFQYSAQSSLLVVRDYIPGVDPYQVSKSNEYVAKVLAKVVNSSSFYSEIMGAGFNINRTYFGEDAKKQRNTWQKTVKAGVTSDAGVLELTVFHPDRSQADQILRAVNATIKSNHEQYHGAGKAIAINVIDQPYVSAAPVKPNIAANLVLAFLFGLVFALSYIYLFPGNNFNLRLWPGGRKARREKEEYFSEDSIYGEDSAATEAAAAPARLRPAPNGYSPAQNLRPVNSNNSKPYAPANTAPGGDYSFYYQKMAAAEAENNRVLAETEELGYEDVMKNGRMENVLGG